MAKGKYQKWLEPEGLLLLEGWARDGLTDEHIARKMGISRSTLNDWKQKYPDISDTLKKGKDIVDNLVENALLKRALGYTYVETTREINGDGELVVTKRVTKEVAPDTTAQIYWLNNRRPDKWRNKREIQADTEALEKLDQLLAQIGGVDNAV